MEEVKGGGVCVLGKQGFVGCDCLIPGGLSFHSSFSSDPTPRRCRQGCGVSGFWDLLGPAVTPAPPGSLRLCPPADALTERERGRERAVSETADCP